jgi:hypothetical protein
MARVVRVLLLVMMVGSATGISLADLTGAEDCDARCEDEADGKSCPPACTTCCCSLRVAAPIVIARASAIVSVPLVSLLEPVAGDTVPTSPDPREILHVPRSVVA